MSPNSPFANRRPLLVVGVLVVLGIAAYGLFVATPYLLGPTLTILTPAEDSTVTGPTLTITGGTSRVAYVSVNDQPVPILEDGTFSVERSFPPGYTVIVIRARDRFGREITETLRVLNTYNQVQNGTEKESE